MYTGFSLQYDIEEEVRIWINMEGRERAMDRCIGPAFHLSVEESRLEVRWAFQGMLGSEGWRETLCPLTT